MTITKKVTIMKITTTNLDTKFKETDHAIQTWLKKFR